MKLVGPQRALGRSNQGFYSSPWVGGFTQRFQFGFFQRAIAAARNALHADGTYADANPFFDGMLGFEEDAAQLFLLGVAHADFVPKIGGATAGGVGLTQRLH